MSDTIGDAIAGLQQRERELELDACTTRARIEEVRELLAQLQHPGRKRARRVRQPQLVALEPPGMHVEGAAHGATADDGDAA
jgi:hypothetical protein